jgi:ribosomal protein L19
MCGSVGIRVRETDAVRIEAKSLEEKGLEERVSIASPGITSIVVLRWGRKGEKYTAPARERRASLYRQEPTSVRPVTYDHESLHGGR